MGVALFIVPERQANGYDTFVNGKSLARSDDMDRLAERAGVRPLMEFFSQDPADLEDFLDAEGVETPPEGLAAEQWFPATDGLTTVRGLLRVLSADPKAVPVGAALIEDLKEFEAVLERLESDDIRWHLMVDF